MERSIISLFRYAAKNRGLYLYVHQDLGRRMRGEFEDAASKILREVEGVTVSYIWSEVELNQSKVVVRAASCVGWLGRLLVRFEGQQFNGVMLYPGMPFDPRILLQHLGSGCAVLDEGYEVSGGACRHEWVVQDWGFANTRVFECCRVCGKER